MSLRSVSWITLEEPTVVWMKRTSSSDRSLSLGPANSPTDTAVSSDRTSHPLAARTRTSTRRQRDGRLLRTRLSRGHQSTLQSSHLN
jgi:hypothetical protein